MSRINTNIQSMIAQRVLSSNQTGLSSALERLSTGLKINRGKDDPAGLIASQALDADIKGTNAAITNADRADQVVNIAEGGLHEVSGMLTELQGLVTNTANGTGLSDAEKSANQKQIDSILQTIDRISGSTSFQGVKLLNGNFDYKTSGVSSSQVTDLHINAAKYNGSNLRLAAAITQSAHRASMYVSMAVNKLSAGSGTTSFDFEVRGKTGARQFSFQGGTSLAAIQDAINQYKDVTGVSAKASGTGLVLKSSDYGSDQTVAFNVTSVTSGNKAATGVGLYRMSTTDDNKLNTTSIDVLTDGTANQTRTGQDVAATINGLLAVGKGLKASVNTDFLDMDMTFSATTAGTLGAVGTGQTGYITGGGADFQLAGKVDINGRVSLGVNDVSTGKLGNTALGYLSSLASGQTNDVTKGASAATNAQSIISAAIDQVSTLRGRLGAFQKNTIGATVRSLNVSVENSSAAQSAIRDADFASETANMTRSQILVNASTNVLNLSNQAPQSVLQLLG